MADAHAIFARYAADPVVTKYVSWPTHRSVGDTIRFLESSDAEWDRWPAGPYLIESRSEGRLLGSTGLSFETPERAVTGYVLAQDAWGQGYATEALTAMIALARSLGIQRLDAMCHAHHSASLHVLLKCGFVLQDELFFSFPNLGSREPERTLRYSLLHST